MDNGGNRSDDVFVVFSALSLRAQSESNSLAEEYQQQEVILSSTPKSLPISQVSPHLPIPVFPPISSGPDLTESKEIYIVSSVKKKEVKKEDSQEEPFFQHKNKHSSVEMSNEDFYKFYIALARTTLQKVENSLFPDLNLLNIDLNLLDILRGHLRFSRLDAKALEKAFSIARLKGKEQLYREIANTLQSEWHARYCDKLAEAFLKEFIKKTEERENKYTKDIELYKAKFEESLAEIKKTKASLLYQWFQVGDMHGQLVNKFDIEAQWEKAVEIRKNHREFMQQISEETFKQLAISYRNATLIYKTTLIYKRATFDPIRDNPFIRFNEIKNHGYEKYDGTIDKHLGLNEKEMALFEKCIDWLNENEIRAFPNFINNGAMVITNFNNQKRKFFLDFINPYIDKEGQKTRQRLESICSVQITALVHDFKVAFEARKGSLSKNYIDQILLQYRLFLDRQKTTLLAKLFRDMREDSLETLFEEIKALSKEASLADTNGEIENAAGVGIEDDVLDRESKWRNTSVKWLENHVHEIKCFTPTQLFPGKDALVSVPSTESILSPSDFVDRLMNMVRAFQTVGEAGNTSVLLREAHSVKELIELCYHKKRKEILSGKVLNHGFKHRINKREIVREELESFVPYYSELCISVDSLLRECNSEPKRTFFSSEDYLEEEKLLACLGGALFSAQARLNDEYLVKEIEYIVLDKDLMGKLPERFCSLIKKIYDDYSQNKLFYLKSMEQLSEHKQERLVREYLEEKENNERSREAMRNIKVELVDARNKNARLTHQIDVLLRENSRLKQDAITKASPATAMREVKVSLGDSPFIFSKGRLKDKVETNQTSEAKEKTI